MISILEQLMETAQVPDFTVSDFTFPAEGPGTSIGVYAETEVMDAACNAAIPMVSVSLPAAHLPRMVARLQAEFEEQIAAKQSYSKHGFKSDVSKAVLLSFLEAAAKTI